MKKAAPTIKTSILIILLGLESYYLTTIILEFVSSGNFFTPQLKFMVSVVLLLLLISYTFTLTVGAWKTWEQYLIVPAPISIGIFLAIFLLNVSQALTASIIVFLLLVLNVYASSRVKDQMIKFNPAIVFRSAVRGILLIFSVIGATLVLMLSAGNPKMMNVGDTIGKFAQEYSKDLISQPNFEELLTKSLPPDILESIPEGAEVTDLLDESGLDLTAPEIDVKTPVSESVNTVLEPYGIFVTPFIAVLIFAFIRFLGGISHILYLTTVGVLITIFTKIGFFHKYEKSVQKEEISFESSTE